MEQTVYSQTRLSKRGAVFYFRAAIPNDLQRHYGKREVIYSLHTKDRREAERLVRQASVRLDDEFEAAREQQSGPPRQLAVADDEAIRAVCEAWRHNALDGDAWSRQQGLSDDEFDEQAAERTETLGALRDILAKGRLERIQPALDQFLLLHRIDFAGDAEAFKRLAWAFLETVIETHLAIMQRDQGEVVRTPSAPSTPLGPTPEKAPKTPDKAAALTLRDCFDDWKEAKLKRPGKSVKVFKSTLEAFLAQVGEKPLTAITSDDVYAHVDHLLKEQHLNPTTIEKRITYLNAIYNAGRQRRRTLALPESPFARVAVPKPARKPVKRLSYSVQDLNTIAACPLYREGERPRGGGGEAAVWLPFLAPFAGARVEELAQLQVADVQCQDGIWYLNITDLSGEDEEEEAPASDDIYTDDEEERSLKNDNSRRRLPIHPQLVEAGFLRYADKMRKANQLWLFPDLRPDTEGKRSGNWSKWYGRYRRKVIGITSRLKPFYSNRHSFRDACREAELGDELSDALMGHVSDKMGSQYGRGFSLNALYRGICKIEYPGVKWPVIIPEEE